MRRCVERSVQATVSALRNTTAFGPKTLSAALFKLPQQNSALAGLVQAKRQFSSETPVTTSTQQAKSSNVKRNLALGLGLLGGAGFVAKQYLDSQKTPEACAMCPLETAEAAGATKEIVQDAPIAYHPNVPPPITRKHPVTLKVRIESDVNVLPLTNRYKYTFWTFNGRVPGPFIRARVGDTLEVLHVNKDPNGMAHNIDFHSCDGPGGGGPLLLVDSGMERTARFKLTNPGLFIYHCAAAPLPIHVANGMYGMILVEPEEGLPKVDKEYAVLQSEFYFDPPEGGETVIEEASYGQGMKEQPEVVVFNGREGAMTNKEVLTSKAGERVRIFFGNGGPNLIANFHMIGAVFDKVYREGDLISPPARSIQTTMVPPGGATVVEVKPEVPGNYTLVDHAIFRTDKGAVGFLNVAGPPRPDLYSGTLPVNCPGCKTHA